VENCSNNINIKAESTKVIGFVKLLLLWYDNLITHILSTVEGWAAMDRRVPQ
jgi:hypothetical protein